VAGESLLIGVTENNINLIKALALIDDEVPAHLPNHFDGALDSFEDGQEYPDDPGAYAPAAARRGEESARPPAREDYDSFAMRGLSEIRDVVSGRIGQRKNR
jgi:flagellar protein FliO/FliZ